MTDPVARQRADSDNHSIGDGNLTVRSAGGVFPGAEAGTFVSPRERPHPWEIFPLHIGRRRRPYPQAAMEAAHCDDVRKGTGFAQATIVITFTEAPHGNRH